MKFLKKWFIKNSIIILSATLLFSSVFYFQNCAKMSTTKTTSSETATSLTQSVDLNPQISIEDLNSLPNDWRQSFKHLNDLPETNYAIRNFTIRARLNPSNANPLFAYGVPISIDSFDVAYGTISDRLGVEYSINQQPTVGLRKKYDVLYRGRNIEGAWIQSELNPLTNQQSFAFRIPDGSKALVMFENSSGQQLRMIGSHVTEYQQKLIKPGVTEILYPKGIGIEKSTEKILDPVANSGGSIEKIGILHGTFADQIRVDANSFVWVTQPFANEVRRYDPTTKTWLDKKVIGKPDGLFVDREGVAWFGEQGTGSLGMFDASIDKYESYKSPNASEGLAIPLETEDHSIWVTDHVANKILRFDRETKSFEEILVPSKGAWPVDLIESHDKLDIWVSLCDANNLGRVAADRSYFKEISLPTTDCPAFLARIENKIYVSLWTKGSFIALDVNSNEITEYQIKGAQNLGPMTATKDGILMVGERNKGMVYAFDPKLERIEYLSGVDGRMKDGLATDNDGGVWATTSESWIFHLRFGPWQTLKAPEGEN